MIKLPVLLWQDLSQQTTAVLLRDEPIVALADSAKAALQELKAWMQAYQQQNPWDFPAEILEPQLLMVQVKCLARYQIAERSFYDSQPIALSVACVHGIMFGYGVAFLPMFKLQFFFHSLETLPQLVQHHVQDFFQQHPQQSPLSYLAAVDFRLDFLRLQETHEHPRSDQNTRLRYLPNVAFALHQRGQFIGRALEREAEIEALLPCLEQGGALALMGAPGVGKSQLLREAVRQLGQTRQSPPQFWLTRPAHLIAGMRYLGQWEERLGQILQELEEVQGTLCIEGLVELITLGGSSPQSSIGAFLLNALEYGELKLIIECTPEELDACRRLLPSLTQKLRPFVLKPLEKSQAIAVLEQTLKESARLAQISTDHHLAASLYQLFRRWQPYQSLPGPAIEMIRKLCERRQAQGAKHLGFADLLSAFAQHLQVDEALLNDAVLWSADELQQDFCQQVMGQDAACEALSQMMLMAKTGLNDPGKPLGVFLFCGPSGVGKTALVKVLAQKLFGRHSRERLIRLDMSEFSGPGAAEQLLTQPNGEPANWLLEVRQYPFSVILLDEIEKAAPEVFDVFLSLFDEGRLTDRFGRCSHFCNSVIILTSNLGAGSAPAIGFNPHQSQDFEKAVRAFFRPEFYNRLDAVVSFNSLSQKSVRQIAQKELYALSQREALIQQELKLEWEQDVVDLLIELGFDPDYGARPLQRALEQQIAVPLAHFLLEHPDLSAQSLRLSRQGKGIGIELS